jgi:kumamolisin
VVPSPASRSRTPVIVFVLFFREKHRSLNLLSRHARRVSDPSHRLYGRYFTRARIARLVSPPPGVVDRCRRWFARKGMRFETTAHPQVCWAAASRRTVARVFGPESDAWLRETGLTPPRHVWPFPESIGSHLKSISATSVHSGHLSRAVKGISTEGGAPAAPASASLRPDDTGMTPADIRSIYNFPPEWTGKGETIGLLNLGGRVDPRDLEAFWTRHGIQRRPPEMIDLPGVPNGGFLARLEPTMGAQWIAAMAPDARLVIYNIDFRAVADPWVAFLSAAIASGGASGRPTILVSTWSLPERTYFARHGRSVFADLLEQAAAAGLTFVAASGDWGVYDGRPSTRIYDRDVADAPWPHGVFPSVEDYVLSVGGTMITTRDPLTELAWSGPLPPSEELRAAMPFLRLATSGGFSEDVAVPWWQQDTLRPRDRPRHFRRSQNLPAVLPTGRGYPDVALMAQGAAVAHDEDWGLVSVGYEAIVDGTRIGWAGGTSVGAPIWAAIIACMNEARRAHRLPRAGFVNPLLYRLEAGRGTRRPFRAVTVGSSDIELRVLDDQGHPDRYTLGGYSAGTGWDPVTGLGVPDVRNLIDLSLRHRPGRRRRARTQ